MVLPWPFDYMAELTAWLRWFTELLLRGVFPLKSHLPIPAPHNPEQELKLNVTNPRRATVETPRHWISTGALPRHLHESVTISSWKASGNPAVTLTGDGLMSPTWVSWSRIQHMGLVWGYSISTKKEICSKQTKVRGCMVTMSWLCTFLYILLLCPCKLFGRSSRDSSGWHTFISQPRAGGLA